MSIKTQFGAEIAELVDGVTKLKLADFEVEPRTTKKPRESAQEEARRVPPQRREPAQDIPRDGPRPARDGHQARRPAAQHEDPRRLPPDRQLKVARETLQIYAPLAHRLGIWKIKWELEDLAFKYLEPEAYAERRGEGRADPRASARRTWPKPSR